MYTVFNSAILVGKAAKSKINFTNLTKFNKGRHKPPAELEYWIFNGNSDVLTKAVNWCAVVTKFRTQVFRMKLNQSAFSSVTSAYWCC
jgi:hypothetical protein